MHEYSGINRIKNRHSIRCVFLDLILFCFVWYEKDLKRYACKLQENNLL